jgi:hypothetical protein
VVKDFALTMDKLTKRQLEIIRKMYEGWEMFVSKSDSTGSIYYGISKDYDNDYFRGGVFSALTTGGWIYQGSNHYYELTTQAEEYIESLESKP